MRHLVLDKVHSQTSFDSTHMGKNNGPGSDYNADIEGLENTLEVDCIATVSVSSMKGIKS